MTVTSNYTWERSFLASVLVMILVLSSANLISGLGLDMTIIPVGEADVAVYVVALDGVGGSGGNDVSKTVEGVVFACQVNSSRYYTGNTNPLTGEWYGPTPIVYVETKINTTVTVVWDWDVYRHLVEFGSNTVILNAHGETVPVPSGYTKEDWVDKIAQAMTHRNVTWVHTAGYPFYYYHLQGVGNGTWGEHGFQRLMSHIGLSDVTCWPKYHETTKTSMHSHAKAYLRDWGWDDLSYAIQAELGRPLNGSDFEDYIILPIWGTREGYATGAVVSFSFNNQSSPGVYVHIGTNQTFDSEGRTVISADYMRGYAGAAAAIWSFSHMVVSEKKIVDAEESIVEAEIEGRTKGLEEARQLLEDALRYYQLGRFAVAVEWARYAQKMANQATRSSFIETHGLYIALVSIVGIVIVSGVTIRWKRNSKKKEY